jgi:hypothetical protein
MLKAFFRAGLLTLILIITGLSLWFYTTITIIALIVIVVFSWLTFMLYIDPPDEWK